jgi:hypothetical protein
MSATSGSGGRTVRVFMNHMHYIHGSTKDREAEQADLITGPNRK